MLWYRFRIKVACVWGLRSGRCHLTISEVLNLGSVTPLGAPKSSIGAAKLFYSLRRVPRKKSYETLNYLIIQGCHTTVKKTFTQHLHGNDALRLSQ